MTHAAPARHDRAQAWLASAMIALGVLAAAAAAVSWDAQYTFVLDIKRCRRSPRSKRASPTWGR